MRGRYPKPKQNAGAASMSIPLPPRHLSEIAKGEWNRAASELRSLGLLHNADMAVLALYSQAWGRCVEAETELAKSGLIKTSPKGYDIQSPYLAIANKSSEMVNRYAQQLGLTPVSRARIVADSSDDEETPEVPD